MFLKLISIPISIGIACGVWFFFRQPDYNIQKLLWLIVPVVVIVLLAMNFLSSLLSGGKETPDYWNDNKEMDVEVFSIPGNRTSKAISYKGTNWQVSLWDARSGLLSIQRISPKGKIVGSPTVGTANALRDYLQTKVK